MKTLSGFAQLIRILPAIILSSVLAFSIIVAREDGISGRTKKTSTNGCSCHGSANSGTLVTVNGPSTVLQGQTATYTITVSNATQSGSGVDIAVRSGTLGVISPELRVLNSELVHNYDIPMTSGQVSLQFSYTAPSFTTADTIFFTGNATNSGGTSSGDLWNWGQSFRVDVIQQFTLNLTAIPEGLYDQNSNTMISDTATVFLRSSSPPYLVVDFAKAVLNNSGSAAFNFISASNGVPFYVVFVHRNSVETWSAAGMSFSANSLSYDFTAAASQAYGNNLKLSGTKWTIYSGDVSQDGAVDASDLSLIDNDATNFVSGYVPTDINGDSFVDGTDFAITDNNAANFAGVIRP